MPNINILVCWISFPNPDGQTHLSQLKELHDIGIAHANAAVTAKLSDAALFIGAVDVDVTVPGIGVAVFQPFEPEDAGEDEVVAGRLIRIPFAYRLPGFENGVQGLPGTVLFPDAK